ncbi:hypothetical protein SASPL_118113 [Salvia splendens]|uniref:Uncharacterized protein n=1 Tax=Salvia splendens TaxID=180675 RepID=A0A8X8ZY60_SALSN|nr:hypothetical protein SASPL_118113 [Salvia splendens]
MCSPYDVRAVTMSYKLTSDEREVYYWLMTAKENDKLRLIYNVNGMQVTHSQLLSVLPYARVHVAVINGWSAFLNHNEKYKSTESQSRLLMSTFPCFNIVVGHYSNWNESQASKFFQESVDTKIKYIDNFRWDRYNLLLEHNNYVSYGWMLRKAKTELLEFKWKTKGITQDCGVFAMRRMETYMWTKFKFPTLVFRSMFKCLRRDG